mmetsp:Transcript_1269/g.3975  ORF Transcript_1269/g.3975 Transcript_1269/m.3975 type:complete len:93 (+) Transcript_1269:89-367(+)
MFSQFFGGGSQQSAPHPDEEQGQWRSMAPVTARPLSENDAASAAFPGSGQPLGMPPVAAASRVHGPAEAREARLAALEARRGAGTKSGTDGK